MDEPTWLTRKIIAVIHRSQIREHGGRPGVRDEDLIQAALARPRHKWAHDSTVDLADLAAAYAYGFSANHGFIDGNKRVGFMAAYTFLGINDYELDAPEVEAVAVVRDMAAGRLGEPEFAAWIRQHLRPEALE